MPKDLIEEGAELQGLRPQTPSEEAEAKVIAGRAGAGSIPPINPQSNFYETSISPSFQHDTSFVGTKIGSPGYPATALMPLGVQANAVTNAAVQSTVINAAPASGGGASSIELQAPSIFTLTDQTVNLPGPLVLALSNQLPGTVFGVPTTTALSAGFDASGAFANPGSAISVSATPVQTGDFAFFFGVAAASAGSAVTPTPTGFSLIDSSTGLSGKTVTGSGAVSASVTMSVTGVNPASAAAMLLLTTGGATPSVVQHSASSGAFVIPTTTSRTVTLGVSATVGNSLLVLVTASAGTYAAISSAAIANVKDNKNNAYQRIAAVTEDVGSGSQFTKVVVLAYLARVQFSGTNVITVTANGNVGDILAGTTATVYELNGVIANTSQIPRFVNPFDTMDPINLGSINMGGGITGTLDLAHGGTNTDLSLTGGTNQVLFQQSAGASITVGTFDYNKLPGVALATKYNNVTLEGLGLVSITGVNDSTNNAANISTTFLDTGSPSGLFRITFYMIVTQVATVSSTLPSITFTWEDPNNFASPTATFAPATPTGNTLTTYNLGSITVYHKPTGAGLSYATTGYASSGATPMNYSVHIRVEQLGF